MREGAGGGGAEVEGDQESMVTKPRLLCRSHRCLSLTALVKSREGVNLEKQDLWPAFRAFPASQ